MFNLFYQNVQCSSKVPFFPGVLVKNMGNTITLLMGNAINPSVMIMPHRKSIVSLN